MPAYVRRHLASHAFAGGHLTDVLRPDIVPWLDYDRLSELVRMGAAEPGLVSWTLLGAWRPVKHRWSFEDPVANAAALDVSMLATDWTPPSRHLPGYSWEPSWADWTRGGTVVGAAESRNPSAAFGEMAGKRVIFRTEDEKIWIWEAATGNKLGEPLETHEGIEVVASVDGSLLCLTRDGHVTVWNPVLRRLERRVDLPGGAYRSLAAGRIDGVPAFVTGGADGELHVRSVETGEALHSPLPAGDYVRAVALNDNLVAAGCSDGSVLVWDLHSELERRRDARAEVNAVALGSHPATGDLLLVVGTSEPAALIWNLDGSSFTSSWRPFPDHDEVRSVALVYLAGDPVVAAASDHGDVWVGNQASPSLPLKLPHPGEVTTVEFGDVDGQMMLATTCIDGNTRLWDPVEPPDVQMPTGGQVSDLTLLDVDGDVHVFGGLKGVVAHWTPDGVREYVNLSLSERHTATSKTSREPFVQVCAGWINEWPVLLTLFNGTADLWQLDVHSPDCVNLSSVEVADDDLTSFDLYVGRGMALVANSYARRMFVTDVFSGRRTELGPLPGDISYGGGFIALPERICYSVRDEDRIHLYDALSGLPFGPPLDGQVRWPGIGPGSLGDRQVLAVLGDEAILLLDVESRELIGPQIDIPRRAHRVKWAGQRGAEVLLTAHHATIRAWSPRTGRKLAEWPFGTAISKLATHTADDGTITVYVSGPGVVASRLLPPQGPDLTSDAV